MLRVLALAAVAACLCACTTSSGSAINAIPDRAVAAAYVPLHGSAMLLLEGNGAGFALGNGIGVTNAHNANLLPRERIIGQSANYDLLFFTEYRPGIPVIAAPRIGDAVIAYGQGVDGELRVARGVVRDTRAPVIPRCNGCTEQIAFTFEGNAGPGFSGGPVLDARTGSLLGIVFGYRDPEAGHGRMIYAYDMARVRAELAIAAPPRR